MPKRPLSAYNLFFKKQREEMLGDQAKQFEITSQVKRKHRKTHGKIGFAEMAKSIGQKWKSLQPEAKREYEEAAQKQKEIYQSAMKEYKVKKKALEKEERKARKEAENSNLESSLPAGGVVQHRETGMMERARPRKQKVAPSPRTDSAQILAAMGSGYATSGLDQSLDMLGRRRSSVTLYPPDPNFASGLSMPPGASMNSGGPSGLPQRNGFGVEATRAALTAAFSASNLPIPPHLLGGVSLQNSQRGMTAAESNLHQQQQREQFQQEQFQRQQHQQQQQQLQMEELLRMRLAGMSNNGNSDMINMSRQQSLALGNGLPVLNHFGGSNGIQPNSAPLMNAQFQQGEYAVSRQTTLSRPEQFGGQLDSSKTPGTKDDTVSLK